MDISNSLIMYKAIDLKLCIICQKKKNKIKTTSTERGRNKIIDVANSKKDEVYHRLQVLKKMNNHIFSYHVDNSCYKQYTRADSSQNHAVISQSSYEEQLSDKSTDPQPSNSSPTAVTKSTSIKRISSRIQQKLRKSNVNKEVCIICNCIKSTKDGTQKYPIVKIQRAQQLLEAVTFFKDKVYDRINHLSIPENLVKAHLLFHKHCLRSYEQKFYKANTTCPVNVADNNSLDGDVYVFNDEHSEVDNNDNYNDIDKTKIISEITETFISRIRCGEAFTLSEITKEINAILPKVNEVSNRDIKLYLEKNYKKDVSFFHPANSNKSTIICSSHIEPYDIVSALRVDSCLKRTAEILREAVKTVNFGLDDKFCDAHELEEAWNNCVIPSPVQIFLAALLDVNEKELVEQSDFHQFDLDDNDDSTSHLHQQIKILRAKSIYQMFCFAVTHGKVKIPLQIMTGLSVYSASKSKSLITALNHSGVSISYNMVRKHREQLAKYTVISNKGRIPLPTHFDCSKFTTGAFDNFDHNEDTLSGLDASHDTVAVLFQEKSKSIRGKPFISKSSINCLDSAYLNDLECQTLRPYLKPTEPVLVPLDYHSHPKMNTNYKCIARDFAWTIARMYGTGESFTDNEIKEKWEQQVPGWAAFNSCLTKDDRPVQTVGYLPILPYPPTQYDTVYSQLCNFNDVLDQLDQKFIPVACDEGIYHIAKHIQLCESDKFKNIVLFLGNFHIIKVLLSCIGKYLRGSGIENIFIENNIFGVGVTEQVLNGTHYSRSVKGFTSLSEALKRLQLKAFFTKRGTEHYLSELCSIDVLVDYLREENFEEAQRSLETFENSCQQFLNDFEDFVKVESDKSQLFKYWSNVLKLITLAQNLIRADRTGDWDLHLQTVRNIQGIFHVMDRTNYARWCSVYLEDMTMLQTTAPEVFNHFSKGRATVKLSNVPFTSISTDQALEVTINRSSKSVSGVIGITQKKNAVAAWGMTYHEVLSIYNFYRAVMIVQDDNEELKNHHDYSQAATQQSEEIVNKMMSYIKSHVNPFRSGPEPLRNIITEQLVDKNACHQLLGIFEIGEELYQKFRQERFDERSKALTDVIPRYNLANFQIQESQKSTIKKSKKNKNEAQKIIELAKERGYCLKTLFSFELTDENILFANEQCLRIETKTKLLLEIEKLYITTKNAPELLLNSEACIIVDMILICKKIKWRQTDTFKDFAELFCTHITGIIKNRNIKRIDFIHESYNINSSSVFNDFQTNLNTESIELHRISDEIYLPHQAPKFWLSRKNKKMIQEYLRSYVLFRSRNYWPGVRVIFSVIDKQPCLSNDETPLSASLTPLQLEDVDDVNMRMTLHTKHAVECQIKNIIILGCNTDIITLLLYYYWKEFRSVGLETLWIKLDHLKKQRIISVHEIANNAGESFCLVSPAMHNLTGCDLTSTIGSKNAAIKASPENYLLYFGQEMDERSIELNIAAAEKYLLGVIKKGTKCNTFDELRFWSYHHGKIMTITELPPTSASIRLHILRAMYVTYIQLHFMKNLEKKNPNLFGYYEDNSSFFAQKINILIPPATELLSNCTCKNCQRKNCSCFQAEVPCISFCNCKMMDTCKNHYSNNVQ